MAYVERERSKISRSSMADFYKVVATRNPSELPDDKDIVVLFSENEELFEKLKQWAYHTDAIILYNPRPEQINYTANIFATVMDRDLIESQNIPEHVSERVIPSELDYDLIENILYDLKPGTERIKTDEYKNGLKAVGNA